jgi:phosphate transport system protein
MKKFEEELGALKRRVVEMGERAQKMIALAVKALVDRDTAGIREVFAHEEEVDRCQMEIDNEAVRLIAVYSPVARDLRFLLMVTRINSELERMGDQAVNMCEDVELLVSEPELKPLIDLPRMAELTRGMVDGALRAFLDGDTGKAEETLEVDAQVDALDDQIFRELLTYMMSSPGNITCSVALILVARSLERIADHATNICEEVVYLVRGDDIRHAD